MKSHLLKLKIELKQLAKTIKDLKLTRKDVPNGYVSGLEGLSHNFRIKHIAYCLLRGRTIDQIENKMSEHNEYWGKRAHKQAFKLVEQIKSEVANEQEIVCDSKSIAQ